MAAGIDDHRRTAILSGDLRRTLLHLALPVLLEQFLSFCVGLYDTILAGHLPPDISRVATGAVGVGAYVGWLASLLFSFVATGTTALVARARGAGDTADANRVLNRSFVLAVLLGLVVIAVSYPMAPYAAGFVLDSPEAVTISTRYLRLDAIGLMFSSVGYVGAAAMRGCGNMRGPMWIFGAVSVINVIASTLLVYGPGPIPELGVDGIVGGTIIARASGGIMMTIVLARGVNGLRLHPSEFRIRDEVVGRILHVGIPAALDGIAMWAGHYVFLRIIGGFGETAFAAHVVGIRVEAITYLPAVAWAAAAATMIGQALGAGDPQRARRAGHEAVRQCGLLGVVITAVFYFGARPIYELMHNNPDVVACGTPAFQLMALFQLPLIVGIVYIGGLRGAGDTRVPMWITLITTLGIRLPVAWYCGVFLDGGLYGAWIGMCVDMLLRGVFAAIRFTRGGWMQVRV